MTIVGLPAAWGASAFALQASHLRTGGAEAGSAAGRINTGDSRSREGNGARVEVGKKVAANRLPLRFLERLTSGRKLVYLPMVCHGCTAAYTRTPDLRLPTSTG